VKTGRCVQVLTGHSEPITAVLLSADGRFAVSSSTDKTIRLWDLAHEQSHCWSESAADKVFAVALSKDGRRLLSGGDEKILQLREIEWELEARDLEDWDQGVSPLLETFLASHVPYLKGLRADRDLSVEKILHALTRQGSQCGEK
jgi:WD40 repeat protein